MTLSQPLCQNKNLALKKREESVGTEGVGENEIELISSTEINVRFPSFINTLA